MSNPSAVPTTDSADGGHTKPAVRKAASTTQDVSPPHCKAGLHPATAANLDKRGRCKLCQRAWFKDRWRKLHPEVRKPPGWDGTLDYFFRAGLIQIQGRHWIWRGKVNSVTGRPVFENYGRRARSVARLIWAAAGREPVPDSDILVQEPKRCQDLLCVQPECYKHVPKGNNLPTEARKRIRRETHARRPYVPLEKRILRRVAKDDTGCWRWLGPFTKGRGGTKRPYFIVRDNLRRGNRTVSVRRFLYERVIGPIPVGHVLYHRTDRLMLCSNSDE